MTGIMKNCSNPNYFYKIIRAFIFLQFPTYHICHSTSYFCNTYYMAES